MRVLACLHNQGWGLGAQKRQQSSLLGRGERGRQLTGGSGLGSVISAVPHPGEAKLSISERER